MLDVPCPNTIGKYLPKQTDPPQKYTPNQRLVDTWMAFIKNHRYETWGTDMFVMPTLFFQVLYVLVIIDHNTRRIVHFAVTPNPNMFWLTQQFRNATPYGHQPKYLIHDNDPVFKSYVFQDFLNKADIVSKPTTIRSPWQNPYAERVIGTIRRELLDHIIPFNQRHLENLVNEYINKYYNLHRPHQGLDGQTPVRKIIPEPMMAKDFELEAKPILGGLYHSYKRIA